MCFTDVREKLLDEEDNCQIIQSVSISRALAKEMFDLQEDI